MSKENTSTCSH